MTEKNTASENSPVTAKTLPDAPNEVWPTILAFAAYQIEIIDSLLLTNKALSNQVLDKDNTPALALALVFLAPAKFNFCTKRFIKFLERTKAIESKEAVLIWPLSKVITNIA